jgi:hypothetical protein
VVETEQNTNRPIEVDQGDRLSSGSTSAQVALTHRLGSSIGELLLLTIDKRLQHG